MWERLELPDIGGPVQGFTFPRGNVLLMLTPDGLVRVALCPVEVRVVADVDALAASYDTESGWLTWDDERHLIYGPDGGDITACDHPNRDRLVMDRDGALSITGPEEREVRQRIDSVRLPAGGSWMFAGFSDHYRWLVAGEPRGVSVFRHASAMPETTHVSELTDSEAVWLQQNTELGLRICRHYFPDVAEIIDCAALDDVFVEWQSYPVAQKPTANQIASGLGVLFGLVFMRRFALEWRVVTDQFGTNLSLYRSQPGTRQTEVIVSPMHMVAKRVKETGRWFEGTFGAMCKQLAEWKVPAING